MKLFAILFLTIAAQTHAEDDLPNLRGVVALTTGEESGFRGRPGVGAPQCRGLTHWCSNSTTTTDARHKCCPNTDKELYCKLEPTVPGPIYNGVCTEVAASAPDEIGIALTTGEERGFGSMGGIVPICREEGKSCSNDVKVLKRHKKRRCCNEGELGTAADLICNPDESVRSGRNGIHGYNGKCVVAQAEAPSEAPSEI